MISIAWHNDRAQADLVLDPATGLLDDSEHDLATLALLSLFTNAPHPDGPTKAHARGGWWGDIFNARPWGSLLWTLEREGKLHAGSAELAEQYASASLQWLLEDGHARDLRVTSELRRGAILLEVRIMRSSSRGIDIGPWSLGPAPTSTGAAALPSTTAGLPRIIPVRL